MAWKRPQPSRWIVCAVAAVGLHVAVVVMLSGSAPVEAPRAPAEQAVVEIIPEPGPAATQPSQAQPVAAETPPAPAVAPTPAERSAANSLPAVPPPAPVEPTIAAPAPEPAQPAPIMASHAEAAPAARPVPNAATMAPAPRHETQVARSKRVPNREPSPQAAAASAAPAQTAPAQAAPAQAAPTQATPTQATPPAAAPAVEPGWRNDLLARLQRAKHYPDDARERGDEGSATVTFAMDRAGDVLSVNLVRSSGSPALDGEAVAMVHRAAPLPPLPDAMPGSTVTLTVPVRFSLRQ